MPSRHPTFDKPPINEVVCGLTFRHLVSMQAPHYGLFWQTIRKQFPKTRTVPPLNAPIEVGAGQGISFTVDPTVAQLPRVWFISEDESTLVQLQQDRFLFNWRAGHGTTYPRYKNIIRSFQSLLEKFQKFVETNGLGDLYFTQGEVSYINHIVRGAGWSSFGEVGEIFPDFSWRLGTRILSAPESFNFRSNHSYAGGTLLVAMQTARSSAENQEQIIRFDLTARGEVVSSGSAEMWNWFRDANTYIVDAFIDLTSKNMQREIWKRKL